MCFRIRAYSGNSYNKNASFMSSSKGSRERLILPLNNGDKCRHCLSDERERAPSTRGSDQRVVCISDNHRKNFHWRELLGGKPMLSCLKTACRIPDRPKACFHPSHEQPYVSGKEKLVKLFFFFEFR